LVRFYLDSDIGKLAADLLRELGHDVEYAIDSGFGAEPDPFHLRQAADSQRILITMNARLSHATSPLEDACPLAASTGGLLRGVDGVAENLGAGYRPGGGTSLAV